MSVEENKKTLYRVFEEVWNKGNLDLIPELVSPDYYHHVIETRGIEGYKQMVVTTREAFPDLHYTVDDVIGEGDWLAARLTWTGTFTGKFGDTEPTGKKISMSHANFSRYENGKCVEVVRFGDSLAFYQQAGVMPPTN